MISGVRNREGHQSRGDEGQKQSCKLLRKKGHFKEWEEKGREDKTQAFGGGTTCRIQAPLFSCTILFNLKGKIKR